MIYAYDKNMVANAQDLVGTMLDFSVFALGKTLIDTYEIFLFDKHSSLIQHGSSKIIMGMSGIELGYEMLGCDRLKKEEMQNYYEHSINARSKEYWVGWALAYYQWCTSLSFNEINQFKKIERVDQMYAKYHEMDISHFVDAMNEDYKKYYDSSCLKRMRLYAGMSQKDLSEATGIPLKTIQQYEQKQKDINHAKVEYLIRMSRALNCDIEMLIEKV